MTWFRIDDSFYDHPKVDDLPDSAIALWVRAGTYCARHLTDGVIPDRKARRLCDSPDEAIKALLDAGMWEIVEGGYLFHDWHTYQPTREAVLSDRATNAARQQAWRDRKRAEREARNAPVTPPAARDSRRDEAVSNAERNALRNDVSNGTRNASVTTSVTGAPARPDPSRPDLVLPSEEQEKTQTLFPLAPQGGATATPRQSTTARNADDPLFGEFYNAYPRKKEPTAARKAWNKAVKTTDPKLIIEAARRYAEERKGQDPQYTAYPASWLNAGAYLSQPDPPPGTALALRGGHPADRPSTTDTRVAATMRLAAQFDEGTHDDPR